jgi:hypothetical protein
MSILRKFPSDADSKVFRSPAVKDALFSGSSSSTFCIGLTRRQTLFRFPLKSCVLECPRAANISHPNSSSRLNKLLSRLVASGYRKLGDSRHTDVLLVFTRDQQERIDAMLNATEQVSRSESTSTVSVEQPNPLSGTSANPTASSLYSILAKTHSLSPHAVQAIARDLLALAGTQNVNVISTQTPIIAPDPAL